MSIKCNICDYQTKHQDSLKRHIDNVHLNKKVECTFCNKKFASDKQLKVHKNNIHNQNIQTNCCTVCKKQIKGPPSVLKNHILNVHSGIRHPCNFCTFEASLSRSLRRHIEEQHTNKKISCTFCSFSTNSEQNLNSHTKRMHLSV